MFIFILFPLVVFPASFSIFKAMGQPTSIAAIWETRFEKSLLPDMTMHLWFLYYLIMISAFFWLLALILKNFPAVTNQLSKLFVALNKNTVVRPLHMAAGVFLALYAMDTYTIITSTEWIPNPATFCMYALFYGYGWTLFNSKYLLPSFVNHAWLLFAVGMVSFVVLMHLLPRNDERAIFVILMALAALSISLFVFSIIGLFLKYANHHSPRMRYISDASYWVYLIHLPFCMLIPWFMLELNIPATIKALIVFFGSTTVSFVSYHYCVRSTFIGQFLNGRKFPNTRVIAETPSRSSQK